MQCDSAGDSVLEAMSLMMNSSTTITLLSQPCNGRHTHTRLCTLSLQLHRQHTHTHIQTTQPPAPAALGDLHLVLESVCAGGMWGGGGGRGSREVWLGPSQPAPSRHWQVFTHFMTCWTGREPFRCSLQGAYRFVHCSALSCELTCGVQ